MSGTHRARALRRAAIGLAALLLALLARPGGPPAAAAAVDFPDFSFERIVMDPDDPALQYSPTGEFIFPSIIRAADYYFHGENSVTRVASSADGLSFTYERALVSTADIPTSTETSYARVFKYTIPSKGNTYIMLFLVNYPDDRRRLYLAWSNDGLEWDVQTAPLISPNAEEGQNRTSLATCAPCW